MKASQSACAAVLVVALMIAPAASAAPIEVHTITSANFSLGYGFLFTWNDNETSAFNTPTTQGDFSFVPAVAGTINSGSGVQFTGRMLSDGPIAHSGRPTTLPSRSRPTGPAQRRSMRSRCRITG